LTALPKATVLAYGQTGSVMIIELGSLQAVGNGRPDLQEDDSPELSRVKDHFQTVDKFHSGIGNDGNSSLKTNDYARGDIGLSSGLPNSPPHFCFSKGEGRSK